MTRSQNGLIPKGALRLDLSFRTTDQDILLQGSNEVGQVLRPKVDFETGVIRPGYHDELGGSERFLQLDAAYGLTSRTAVLASMPLVAHRSFDIGHPPVVRETYTTSGTGDALLAVRHALRLDGGALVAGFSVELPTGPSRLVSQNRGDAGILDPMIQPGTGSVDFVGTLQYARTLASLHWTLAASYQANRRNGLGFEFGDDAITSITAGRPLVGRLSVSLQGKLFTKGRSRFEDQPINSSGTTVLYVTPGVSFATLGGISAYAFVPLPIYRHVNEAQLAPHVTAVVGISKSLSF